MKLKTENTDQSIAQESCNKELSTIAKGAGTVFIGKVLGNGIQYLYFAIVAKALGVHSFGLFMLSLTIVNFTGIIGRLGLESGVVHFVSIYKGVNDPKRIKGTIIQALKYSFLASFLIGGVLFFTAGPLSSRLFNKPELHEIVRFMAISLPFSSIMIIALASTQGFQIMKHTAYCYNLFWPAANLVLVFVFFFLGFKVYGVASAHIISICLAAILSLHFLKKTFLHLKNSDTILETRKLFRFSLPLQFVLFLNFLLMWTDTLMLGYFTPLNEVGIYNAAVRTAMFTSVILISFNSIFAPVLSDLYNRGEMQKLESLFKTVTKWTYAVSLPIFLLILLLSKEIIVIAFGHNFEAGWISLLILSFAQFINASVGSVGVILATSGRQDLMMYNTIGISVLNITLNYLLIPVFGINGAAVASGISIVVVNLVMLVEVYIILKIHPYGKMYIQPTIICSVIFTIFFFICKWFSALTDGQRLATIIPTFIAAFIFLTYKWGISKNDGFIIEIFMKKLTIFSKKQKS